MNDGTTTLLNDGASDRSLNYYATRLSKLNLNDVESASENQLHSV